MRDAELKGIHRELRTANPSIHQRRSANTWRILPSFHRRSGQGERERTGPIECRNEHSNSVGGCSADTFRSLEEAVLLRRQDFCYNRGHFFLHSLFYVSGITWYVFVIPSPKHMVAPFSGKQALICDFFRFFRRRWCCVQLGSHFLVRSSTWRGLQESRATSCPKAVSRKCR